MAINIWDGSVSDIKVWSSSVSAIYLGSTQVRGGSSDIYEVTENTLRYFKFNWDATDYSNNWVDWTYPNGTPTYDLTVWIDWAYHWWYPFRYWNLWSFDWSSGTFTVSFLIKTTVDTWLFRFTNYWNWDRNNFDCTLSSWKISASVYTWSSTSWTARWSNLNDWNWHHIVITKNWSTYTWYQDWTQMSTWSNSSTIICYNSSQIWCHPSSSSVTTSMWMDEFVVEKIAWDASTVSSLATKYLNKLS